MIPALAKRFLLSKRSDGFISLISWVSILGVVLGTLALVVVTSAINGFEKELTKVITGVNGDVFLYTRGSPVGGQNEVIERIKKASAFVQHVTPTFISELMVGGPTSVSGAVIEGVELSSYSQVASVTSKTISGRFPEKDFEVALGDVIAQKIGAVTGSKVRLIAPFSSGSEHSEPKVLDVVVTGIVKIGMYQYDSKTLFIPIKTIQSFFEQDGRVTSFKIKLKDLNKADEVASLLTQTFGYPFRAKSWNALFPNILQAISLEKRVIAVVLTAIIIVAAFNMVSTLMMLIHDKTKEIAILKAMGFKPSQSFQLFCVIGIGIGVVGTGVGVGLGLLLNLILLKTKLISLPQDIYYIDFLPVAFNWGEILWIAVFSLFICFLATLYPSWKISTKPPLEGIREE